MYLVQTYKKTMRETASSHPPFGPAFTDEQINQADKLEVWGSSFNDPGDDFCEFRLMKNNKIIFSKRVDGF